MLRFFLLAFFLNTLLVPNLHARECSDRDSISYEKLKIFLKKKNIEQMDENEKSLFEADYGSLFLCPEQNYNNPQLSAQEKENLKSLYLTDRIDGFERDMAKNIRFVDLDFQLVTYTRIYQTLYGKNASLPPGIQLIIKNKALYFEDRKKNCSESHVDTSYIGEVRDQSDMGWCYAYALADLLSFHAKKLVSAIDIAVLNNNFSQDALKDRINYSRDVESFYDLKKILPKMGVTAEELEESARLNLYDSVRNGGLAAEALKLALQKGVCLEKDMPSTFENKNITLKRRLQAPLLAHEPYASDGESCVDHLGLTGSVFVNLNILQIEEVLKNSSPDVVLFELRQKNCKEKVTLRDKKPLQATKQTNEQIFSIIDSQLDKKQPLVATYSAEMITKGRAGVHISSVVGRRFNAKTNKCEYKIRNSWGKHNDFQSSTKIRHEDGYFWVDDSDLKKNIIRIDAID